MTVEPDLKRDRAVNHFLTLHRRDLEIHALKLARIYSIDLHELLSRTYRTTWKNWTNKIEVLLEPQRRQYALTTLANHARNLSRVRDTDWKHFRPASNEELEAAAGAIPAWRDPAVEAVFKDERLTIIRAIAHLDEKQKDVMALIALGWDHPAIVEQLNISHAEMKKRLGSARRALRRILDVRGGSEEP